jgi:hypothetical protein
VYVLTVTEEDMMMLIVAINLSYSKTFIVVDSQWIRDLPGDPVPAFTTSAKRRQDFFWHHPYNKGEPMGDFSATQCSTATWCAIKKLPLVPEFS